MATALWFATLLFVGTRADKCALPPPKTTAHRIQDDWARSIACDSTGASWTNLIPEELVSNPKCQITSFPRQYIAGHTYQITVKSSILMQHKLLVRNLFKYFKNTYLYIVWDGEQIYTLLTMHSFSHNRLVINRPFCSTWQGFFFAHIHKRSHLV